MNELKDLKLFQLLNGDFFVRSMPRAATNDTNSDKCVNLEFQSEGRVSELRACYPTYIYDAI